MTEAEWESSSDPAAMLTWANGIHESEILDGTPFPAIPTPRNLRLFAVACCRLVWP